MEIWVEFNGGRWHFSPDPATVARGTPVIWKFQTNTLPVQKILWTAYFDHGSPFGDQGNRFITNTVISAGQHVGTTGAMSADEPGDYKYGVRADDVLGGTTLGDDDPRLIVS